MGLVLVLVNLCECLLMEIVLASTNSCWGMILTLQQQGIVDDDDDDDDVPIRYLSAFTRTQWPKVRSSIRSRSSVAVESNQ